MATRKLTDAQAVRAIQWFLKALNIGDWQISYDMSDNPPAWVGAVESNVMGQCSPDRLRKRASIWISPARCVADDTDLIYALFHECFHAAIDDTGIDSGKIEVHALIYSLATIFTSAYRKGVKA